MFLHHSPFWLKAFFPGFVWHIPTQEKKIFLTFDDGPIPDITESVLETLAQFKARATFFCIGNNVQKHPDIFQKLLDQNHSIGNHTFNHMNGWKTEDDLYLENIKQCDTALDLPTNLFRPPYGRIKRSQSRVVRKERRIIMWDVLSGDFSKEITKEVCLGKSIQYTRPGSIVLFHDSVKAAPNMQYVLPRFLEHFINEGFTFEAMAMK
ncbi:polysaccharide deacetylase family protein [Dyadobacter fanqingshengii]|uniref:Polysaccharide deacetylase family protein n=1 Tax=Dyadobacter fanqingshengii TaxID=2906443 RepID=A0A9X1P8R7_9BACT|nr:polysaccharide deacetylase family protein [Dyadobacter fanqingshengii]MCF0040112.1 polysaccharide deacetylase family protein [Dyadobacter fanqingshengii]MCF2502397.1 polysaccharide deacetylase family protein [Dyadobacter fanqingshengii]USJ38136.1 polysaccharide deacetylase family protein [Dyadobacter fanqingshengii]